MSSKVKPELEQDIRASAGDASERRQNLLRILFVHRSAEDVERCLHELRRVRFTVSSEVVLTLEQFAERLRSQLFDLIVAEYPSPNWREAAPLDILREMKEDIPVILLVHDLKREIVADFILKGAADCIEVESLGHLPVAVHRALAEKALRDQRDRAEKDLRRSEARYRALAGNLSYGICRCSLDGRFRARGVFETINVAEFLGLLRSCRADSLLLLRTIRCRVSQLSFKYPSYSESPARRFLR
jgi:PAS domain-containing protein